MIEDRRIGVLAGGISAERDVSLRTGSAIYNALRGRGYNVVLIDTRGSLCESLRNEKIEVAFVALHGGLGENGAVQGFLEVMDIPYTGSGILASALAMDKEASKKIFLHHGIPVAPYKVFQRSMINIQQLATYGSRDLMATLGIGFPMPWVVKPVAEGSSVGVSIVRTEDEMCGAMEGAFSYGQKIIVEKYIKGREIQIGILGQRILGGVEVRPSEEFYSYQAKYTPGLTEYILPPEVDEHAYERLKTIALNSHNALGCRGATRVDLILGAADNPYILEVNTIPGMTETSLLPKIAGLSGIGFADLVEDILKLSIIGEE
ncbi:MAG: D-alanine--D-alanine ligase [Dissulfurispiraceae bacterium]